MTPHYTVHPKENSYFFIKVFVSLVLYLALGYFLVTLYEEGLSPQMTVLVIYATAIILFLAIRLGMLVGSLKGNSVKITEHQMPDIYDIVKRQSQTLGLSKVPHVYLMQAGGMLNAFATRFLGTNYVVIYSDVLEEAYENNLPAVEFIIGHELGHVKRKHILKRTLLFPSLLVPFLGAAYSRACEYTCDSIGASLSPKGARSGLVLLAAGKKLHNKVNADKFMSQTYSEDGFWPWFTEKASSHPMLAKRVLKFRGDEYAPMGKAKPVLTETVDHSAYAPRM